MVTHDANACVAAAMLLTTRQPNVDSMSGQLHVAILMLGFCSYL